MLRQQPLLNTIAGLGKMFPRSRRFENVTVGSDSGWDGTQHQPQIKTHTHAAKQSTQSPKLAEFSAVLPSALIPVIQLILQSRPLKSCVQPQQTRVFIDDTASHAAQQRRSVKSEGSCSWLAKKDPEVVQVSCFCCRSWWTFLWFFFFFFVFNAHAFTASEALIFTFTTIV